MKKINQEGKLDFMVIVALVVVAVVGCLLAYQVISGDDSGSSAAEIELQEQQARKEAAKKAEAEEIQKQDEKENEIARAAEPDITGELTLKASQTDTGVALSWTDTGVDAQNGYKIVYSATNTAPEYGVHLSQYANVGDSSSSLNISDGRSYNFRICAYRSESLSCDSYSPTVVASAPKYDEERVVAGPMTIVADGDNLSWTFAGTAPHGFMVVMNKTGSPKYPTDSVQYVSSDSRSIELPKEAKGTYFVRVCKYTADANTKGGCTDYSNQIEYVIE